MRSGSAILALVSDDELSRLVLEVSKEFRKIEPEALRKVLPAILADSREYTAEPAATQASASGAAAPGAAKPGGKTPNLDQYTVNLTENAQHRERSTPSWAAISRSARWWTSSRGGGRTTPS